MRPAIAPYILSVFTAILLLSSCSNTRFLKDDQVLYTGLADVKVTGKEKLKKIKPAAEAIDNITYYSPNNALFGRRIMIPLGLWTYNYLGSKKEGKKGGWFYRNFAKDPVLISTVNPELRCDRLKAALFGYGFFHVRTSYEIKYKKSNSKKARIAYAIELDSAFRIKSIKSPPAIDSVDLFINNYVANSKLQPGDVFDLEFIKSEKRTMASLLVEQGYYFFSPDDIEYIADTTKAPYQVDLMIRKSLVVPPHVLHKYTIDQVRVVFNHGSDDSSGHKNVADSVFYNGIYIIGAQGYLTPEATRHCIQFDSGDLYSTARHQGTVKQLNNYGVFRNVKVMFAISDTTNHKLNMYVELIPKDNVSLDLEGYVQSKSTGFAGPGLETTLANGNIGHKANRLQLKLTGEFEWQWGKNDENDLGTHSYSAGINTAFVFPRFILPFTLEEEKNLLASKTICDLGFEFLNNVRYYRMSSLTASFGYQWKKRQKITHTFTPARINMVNLLETTSQFDSIVESNIYVKKSFEEQTILGMEYGFTYDNSARKKNGILFQAIIGTSGNFASLISSVGNDEQPYTILGNVYSQFLKGSLDLRYYTKTTKHGLVFRIYTGAGYSYGNSTVMPYIEQFYSGGSTSIRAFTARSLGPGSYKPVELNGIIDQTGDIKLEFNTEYRVPITNTVYGALFADVGNVWLLHEDVNRPGSEFDFNTFTKQLAVGSGLGLRFDFDFFVLRTDFGLPLRNTYKSDFGFWLDNFSDIFNGYRFNLAIGYPF